jgi:hypothetical protein
MNLESPKKNQQRSKFILFAKIAALLLLFLIISFFLGKDFLSQDAITDREKETLPSPVRTVNQTETVENNIAPAVEITNSPIPGELNLDVPFTSQAPEAVWDYTHEEACEEAAIFMANRYFKGEAINGPEGAEEGIQQIIAWEKENLGFFESTTAEETARVIKEFLNLKAETIKNPTVIDIKEAISRNELVLVPASGRDIGNPFYKAPGPLYHFLLIKGYTADKFITNDAGTKRGANYPYDFKTILNANHDWNGGDVLSGDKVIILVYK